MNVCGFKLIGNILIFDSSKVIFVQLCFSGSGSKSQHQIRNEIFEQNLAKRVVAFFAGAVLSMFICVSLYASPEIYTKTTKQTL